MRIGARILGVAGISGLLAACGAGIFDDAASLDGGENSGRLTDAGDPAKADGGNAPHDSGAGMSDSGASGKPDSGGDRADSGADAGTGDRPDAGSAEKADAGSADRADAGTGDGADAGGSSCPAGGTLRAGESTRSITVGGKQRTYILHVPQSYTGRSAVPLVLDFHGLGGTASQQASISGYRQQSDKIGFVVAFPDGLANTWNNGIPSATGREDDVGFARAIVNELRGQGCIDSRRVYSVGFSMGGGMTYSLACEAADVFAAAAPSAMDFYVGKPCTPSRPISVLSFRGTADNVVPYNGQGARDAFMGAEGTFQKWKEIDGCTGTAARGSNGCTMYSTCKEGTQVGLCTLQNGGHAPGSAETGWEFLSQFRLP